MPLPPAQATACLSVISTLTSHRENRRNLSAQFTELPDRDAWPEYYRVIPEPRSLEGIKDSLEKGRYNSAGEVWGDLKLVFLNAMYYNEEGSVIYRNAKTLETLLSKTWNNTPTLPRPPLSPSPGPTYSVQPVRAPPTVAPTPPRRRRKSPGPEEEVSMHHSEERAAEKQALLVQAEHMIHKVEDSMERWGGYGDMGWMAQPAGDAYKKYAEIVQAIRDYKDEAGDRISKVLDKLPEESSVVRNLSYSTLLSLDIIEAKIQRQQYPTAMEFDRDLTRLFEKGRRYFQPASKDFGDVILLQRMYHQLTAPDASNSSSGANFASVPAGPGNAKPIRSSDNPTDGVTTFRISSKERQFTDFASFKGQTFRVGDYVHLMNPDDPAKPIVAQIFKTFVAAGAEPNQQSLAVCWYYRPEQTVHPAHKHFYINEVFKTSHFADHAIGDVIEKIGCQFTTKYTRGRPKPPYWYPGWPLYICDSRYNDKEKSFVKIKNWNSCIPDELRKMDFMPVQPFERTIPLRKVPSPFLSGGTGPGKIGEPEAVQLREEESEREREREAKRRRIMETGGGPYGRIETSGANQRGPTAAQRRQAEDRTVVTAAGGMSALKANGSSVEALPAETAQHFARDEERDAVLWFSGPPLVQARPPGLRHSLAYLHFRATGEKPLKRGGAVAMEEEEAEGGQRSMVM